MFSELSVIALLQSPAGGGKSTLAKKIKAVAELNSLSCEICSADNYFINPDTKKYEFDANKLYMAHSYCKYTFEQAVQNFTNWIIVDNTNTDLKSIRHYYDPNNGYNYKIVRPNTPWYFDAEECFKKNTHNVPLETIERMINSIKKFSLEDVKADILWI